MGDKLGRILAFAAMASLMGGCDLVAAATDATQFAAGPAATRDNDPNQPPMPEVPGGPERPPCNICARRAPP